METPAAVAAAAKLKKIREAYLKQVPTQLEAIRTAYEELTRQSTLDATLLEDLHRRLHTLKGSSASFGLKRLSAAADTVGVLIKGMMQSPESTDKNWRLHWEDSYSRLEQEVTQLDLTPTVDVRAVELVAASELPVDDRPQKLVYLCEDDSYQRLTLMTQMECFGFRVVSFGTLEQLQKAVNNAPPDILVMDMIFPDRPTGGAEMTETIRQDIGTDLPVIFISSSNHFLSRLAAVRAGSSAYFVKPINVTELCTTISNLTASAQPEPYRILIVDDDPLMTDLYAAILQEAGMSTRAVNNPLQIMEPLNEFKPDLILTDMYMPGCNGMELAATVRQIGHAFSIPIIFLSSETDLGKQFYAMRMGGDEFLTKPVVPENLISAVAGRAERMKIIRSFMVRDSMTGLFNHTATKEHLGVAVARAERNGEEICFAMIDVDRFKLINDRYGHAMGDQVLMALARMLGQRVRKGDIVGRYGGEEFALVLPDCPLTTALELINQLRESFASLRFPVGNETFSSSFSCGVASLSCFPDPEKLCKAADTALYQAKEAGRNRVLAAEVPA